MKSHVSPRQVALALGVSEASVKRWCDQRLFDAVLTAGGHRRIAVQDVVRFARERGDALVRPELLGLPAVTGAGAIASERALEEARTGLAAGDEELVVRLVSQLYLAGRSATDICERVLAPALHALGNEWEHGELEIYEERRACEVAAAALNQLARLLPPPAQDAPRAIGGTLSDDPYTLPTAMCALALRELGWRAENLGAGLPAAQLAAATRRRSPELVWVSLSTGAEPERRLGELRKVAAAAKARGARLVVGGRGLSSAQLGALVQALPCERLGDLALLAAGTRKRRRAT